MPMDGLGDHRHHSNEHEEPPLDHDCRDGLPHAVLHMHPSKLLSFPLIQTRPAICGHLGDEELRIIGPALESCRAQGVKIDGPLPADTVFVPKTLERYDAVLAMYHDQGLPVLKHAGFGHSVNVTLGLPIVRTSVDHGTALDLAGTGRADAGSLAAAIALALEIARK